MSDRKSEIGFFRGGGWIFIILGVVALLFATWRNPDCDHPTPSGTPGRLGMCNITGIDLVIKKLGN